MAEGMPLLSGPPPDSNEGDSSHCRKCGKEFGLFTRSRKCNHCGYMYCHSCSDYQALMPRSAGGANTGYDTMPVCAYCIELLQITASGKSKLRSLPMGKLKKYIDAYNLKAKGAVEKDDLIDVIVNARGANGCLPPESEHYYRKYSVPNPKASSSSGTSAANAARNFFNRTFGDSSQSQPRPAPSSRTQPQRARTQSHPEFPRPDLDPNYQRQQQQRARPQQQPQQQQQQRRSQPQYHPQYPYGQYAYPQPGPYPYAYPPPPNPYGYGYPPYPYGPPPQPAPNYPYAQTPATASQPHIPRTQSAQPPPRPASTTAPERERIPSLDELLNMTEDDISKMSVHVLKDVLFHNHVPARQVLEKAELVSKVMTLIEDEKRERERKREEERREEEEYQARQSAMREELRAKEQREGEEREKREREKREREERDREARPSQETPAESEPKKDEDAEMKDDFEKAKEQPKPLPPKAQAMAATLERTGLCVICQDEEANIAIVDCGHLAMCRSCADHVMSTTRECPLCRTRIVTEARLLRIFKP